METYRCPHFECKSDYASLHYCQSINSCMFCSNEPAYMLSCEHIVCEACAHDTKMRVFCKSVKRGYKKIARDIINELKKLGIYAIPTLIICILSIISTFVTAINFNTIRHGENGVYGIILLFFGLCGLFIIIALIMAICIPICMVVDYEIFANKMHMCVKLSAFIVIITIAIISITKF